MDNSYLLMEDHSNQKQMEGDLSFIGGHPCIPASMEIPVCQLCGAEQTFFFQVAFPEEHIWHGFSMAVFACTSCAHEEYLIPEMLQDTLRGVDIPEGFLEDYQKNFKCNIFETKKGVYRDSYQEKIQFKRWKQTSTSEPKIANNKLGGQPNWLLGDETPATYKISVPMLFLMQLMEDIKFEIVQDAPPQIRLGLRGNPEPSKHHYYELFLANNIYFFGTKERLKPLVYVLTQI
ncbi:hypothetical protein ACFVSW_00215 [Neobacillus sp. NPDC058068]|uniref:hypothetical protein n=1 Tax=Neobacillus sp. NPDC058068 TaxID=3346325 RepID=UPI0036D9499C